MRTRKELEEARKGKWAQIGHAMEITSEGAMPHYTQIEKGETIEQQTLEVLLDIRDLLQTPPHQK